MSEEPKIVINGVSMTSAQAGTMRTALEHFASSFGSTQERDNIVR